MVILASIQVINDGRIDRYKAPKGMMYLIEDMHFSVITGGSNRIVVVDYLVEDERTILDALDSQEGIIGVVDMTITGLCCDIEFQTPIKSKFFSVALNSANSAAAFVVIAGQLVSASKIDLITEWFRKGR